MSAERITVDATPGAHRSVDALATVSFKLACGCRIPPGPIADAERPFVLKSAGSSYPCNKHGEQVITRASTYLVGWREGR